MRRIPAFIQMRYNIKGSVFYDLRENLVFDALRELYSKTLFYLKEMILAVIHYGQSKSKVFVDIHEAKWKIQVIANLEVRQGL